MKSQLRIMKILENTQIWIMLILLASYLAIMGLAGYKLIKSKISDWTKIYLFVLMTLTNIICAVVFIIYHDYILQKTLRAD
jgi:hypothetical protein